MNHNLKLLVIQVRFIQKNKCAEKIQKMVKIYLFRQKIDLRIKKTKIKKFTLKIIKIQSFIRQIIAKKKLKQMIRNKKDQSCIKIQK